MSQQPSREEELFNAALELASKAERAALVERECAGDAVLRANVEALLRASGVGVARIFCSQTAERQQRPDGPFPSRIPGLDFPARRGFSILQPFAKRALGQPESSAAFSAV